MNQAINNQLSFDHHAPEKPLWQMLLDKGVISDDQLRIALQEQNRSELPIATILVQLGFISEATVRDILSENFSQPGIELSHMIADSQTLALIPQDFARRHQVMPLSVQQQTLSIAIADPGDIIVLDQVRSLIGKRYQLQVRPAAASDISNAIDRHYGVELSIDGILHEIEPEQQLPAPEMQEAELNQPVIRLIDALFNEAVHQGASDIHFEPEGNFLRIRYRIDGVLHQVRSLHKSYWPAMVVRLKVMSNMNIAEKRAPQDGRISAQVSGRLIDFRVSTLPTTYGENLVLRILDRQKGIVPLADLSLSPETLQQLQELISQPEGLLLVTGPTGSGKTTTLYSMLNHLNHESVNIMTLEDPVEYPMPLTRQTSINEAGQLDFSSGVRAIMRQDPDIILVGEIRDKATADMAFRAAMTGHQVFSTLHTSSAIATFPRLLDMGIPADILTSNLNGVIAQRLVRTLCPVCKIAHAPGPGLQQKLQLPTDTGLTLYRENGCQHCHYTGYRGRKAIMELLTISEAMDELICQRSSTRKIQRLAIDHGFQPLALHARALLIQGLTSYKEISRVVDLKLLSQLSL